MTPRSTPPVSQLLASPDLATAVGEQAALRARGVHLVDHRCPHPAHLR